MNKSNSITFEFENCEHITIPSKFIHTLKIIKPQISEQYIDMDWSGNFSQHLQHFFSLSLKSMKNINNF